MQAIVDVAGFETIAVTLLHHLPMAQAILHGGDGLRAVVTDTQLLNVQHRLVGACTALEAIVVLGNRFQPLQVLDLQVLATVQCPITRGIDPLVTQVRKRRLSAGLIDQGFTAHDMVWVLQYCRGVRRSQHGQRRVTIGSGKGGCSRLTLG